MNLDKLISIARSIKEEAVAAPTNAVGGGQIAGTKEAGDDPPVFGKPKKYAKGGKGSRKWWLQYLKR
jgi:hypothetical protein